MRGTPCLIGIDLKQRGDGLEQTGFGEGFSGLEEAGHGRQLVLVQEFRGRVAGRFVGFDDVAVFVYEQARSAAWFWAHPEQQFLALPHGRNYMDFMHIALMFAQARDEHGDVGHR